MTHIITIETNNTRYFEQFKKLAQRLGVSTTERHDDSSTIVSEKTTLTESNNEKEQLFYSLFGSWQGNETGDELTKQIYSSRVSSTRDIEL